MNNYIPTQSEKPKFEQDPRNEASFKRTMERACMLRPEQLRRVTVDVFAAIRTVRAGASAARKLREPPATALPLYDFLPLDQIEDTCRALLVAHERYVNESDETETEQPKHEAQAIEIRRIAIGDLTSLAARGVIPAEEVAKIRPRSNGDELLLDLNAIDRLLTIARQKLGERLWVTVEEQEYLRATATALSETVLVSTDDGKAARAHRHADACVYPARSRLRHDSPRGLLRLLADRRRGQARPLDLRPRRARQALAGRRRG